ncbi:MAG: HAMP domain-containing sensor histidine kinase, partial [Cyanobacteria bacterium J06642_11]
SNIKEINKLQCALMAGIFRLVQEAATVVELGQWSTQALFKHFNLHGCQLELFKASQRVVTLVAGVGEGWRASVNHPRPLESLWEIYHPLTEGKRVEFSSGQPVLKDLVPQGLAWLGCPMVIDSALLGVVWLTRPETDGFTNNDQLQHCVNYIAIALHQIQLRETANHQQAEIQQLRQAKDDFLQLISHELFIPLGNIQLSTQTLEKIFKDASWRQVPQRRTVLKVLSLLSQECRRQKQFTDNLITLMFPEEQKASEPTLVNLSNWLPSLLRAFGARFEQESIAFKTLIPTEPLLLDCDINYLERIITELLNNALRYTPADKTVTVTLKVDDATVAIAVSNTGVHIPAQHQPHIFEKFYRVPELDQRQYGGSGLGLTIAQQLVTSLGGTLGMKSTKQKTTFTIKLPRGMPHCPTPQTP